MKEDSELRKTFDIFFDDRGIIYLTFLGAEYDENNTRQAELVRDECLQILKGNPGKVFHALVDITPLGSTGRVSEDSGKIYRHLINNKQLNRIALVGVTDIKSRVLGFILTLMKLFNRKMGWFPNKQEALFWLESFNR